jgi:hypothetical protein
VDRFEGIGQVCVEQGMCGRNRERQ